MRNVRIQTAEKEVQKSLNLNLMSLDGAVQQ